MMTMKIMMMGIVVMVVVLMMLLMKLWRSQRINMIECDDIRMNVKV